MNDVHEFIGIHSMDKIFKHKKPELPSDCTFAISPSSIGKFFQYPRIWYEENILQSTQQYPTTAMLTGTICHYIYEHVAKDRKKKFDEDLLEKRLIDYVDTLPSDVKANIDINQIMIDVYSVAQNVVNKYILPHDKVCKGVEKSLCSKVLDDIYVAGTVDRIDGDCVVDFKTVSKKPVEGSQIPFNYLIQLLSYAYMLRQHGYEINRIRIVWGILPTKTIGARVMETTQEIDFTHEKLIKDTLQLIAETVIKAREDPSLIHLLFKSMDLKCIN